MGRFYRTASGNPLDYIRELNIPLMAQVVQTNDQYITDELNQTSQLSTAANTFPYLQPDEQRAKEITSNYSKQIDDITDTIRADPANWRNKQADIQNLSRNLQDNYRVGEISKISGNYSKYKGVSDYIDKQVEEYGKSGKGISGDRARAYKQYFLNNFMKANPNGTAYDSKTGNYNSLEAFDPMSNIDIRKELAEGLDKMKADGEIRITDSVTGSGEYLNKETNKWEGITPEKILRIVSGKLNNPQLMDYLKQDTQAGIVNGVFDNDPNSNNYGKFITPYNYNKVGLTSGEQSVIDQMKKQIYKTKNNNARDVMQQQLDAYVNKLNERTQLDWNPNSFLAPIMRSVVDEYAYSKTDQENDLTANSVWTTRFSQAQQNARNNAGITSREKLQERLLEHQKEMQEDRLAQARELKLLDVNSRIKIANAKGKGKVAEVDKNGKDKDKDGFFKRVGKYAVEHTSNIKPISVKEGESYIDIDGNKMTKRKDGNIVSEGRPTEQEQKTLPKETEEQFEAAKVDKKVSTVDIHDLKDNTVLGQHYTTPYFYTTEHKDKITTALTDEINTYTNTNSQLEKTLATIKKDHPDEKILISNAENQLANNKAMLNSLQDRREAAIRYGMDKWKEAGDSKVNTYRYTEEGERLGREYISGDLQNKYNSAKAEMSKIEKQRQQLNVPKGGPEESAFYTNVYYPTKASLDRASRNLEEGQGYFNEIKSYSNDKLAKAAQESTNKNDIVGITPIQSQSLINMINSSPSNYKITDSKGNKGSLSFSQGTATTDPSKFKINGISVSTGIGNDIDILATINGKDVIISPDGDNGKTGGYLSNEFNKSKDKNVNLIGKILSSPTANTINGMMNEMKMNDNTFNSRGTWVYRTVMNPVDSKQTIEIRSRNIGTGDSNPKWEFQVKTDNPMHMKDGEQTINPNGVLTGYTPLASSTNPTGVYHNLIDIFSIWPKDK